MEEQITRMLRDKVMIKIFGLQRWKVTGEWRKLRSGSSISCNLLSLLPFKPRSKLCVRTSNMHVASDTAKSNMHVASDTATSNMYVASV